MDALYAISPKWFLSGRVSICERTYDDFYEDVTFVEREDTSVGVSASLVWRPSRSITLAAGPRIARSAALLPISRRPLER